MSYYIFDHENGLQHPWNLVLCRDKENISDYGALYRTINGFKLREVHKRFGLNLTEFLDLPREFVDLILRICVEADTEEIRQYETAKSQMDRGVKDPNQKDRR